MELFLNRLTGQFLIYQEVCACLYIYERNLAHLFVLILLIWYELSLVQQQLRNMSEVREMVNKPYLLMVR